MTNNLISDILFLHTASLKSKCFLFIFIILVFILDFRLVRKLVFLYFNVNVSLKEIPCLIKVTLPILIKINVLSANSLKEVSSLEQCQYVKGFQMFHTGVKLSRMCRLSLLVIFTFWVFTLWHITLVLFSKRKSSITAPPPLTTKHISKATKSVLVE